MLSPIDRLIDQACGLKPRGIISPYPTIMLECPQCHKSIRTAQHPTDPPQTAKVMLACPPCIEDGADPTTREYFDKEGSRLIPERDWIEETD